jgi:magnesium transporter
MRKGLVDNQRRKRGMDAGSLIHVGERKLDEPKITIIEYDDTVYSNREVKDFQECRQFPDRDTVTWINVDGIHESTSMEALGKAFGLHPLVLEDVMNAGQRPKYEEYDDCIFVVLKMLDYDPKEEQIVVEQISLVLGKNFVITFQERVGDVFNAVRERIKNAQGRIRKMKADYLAYRLMDAIVDHYFVALEAMGDLVETVESQIADDPVRVDARELHILKRETLFLRKAIWPAREVVGTFSRIDENDLVSDGVMVYLRDVYDHVLQVSETIEVQRDILASMLDVYHSALSNKMNEIMKVLAIISTIFIPLTFIAGIYGMNFVHMPELTWWFGYPACLLLMAGVFAGLIVYFKRKGWF